MNFNSLMFNVSVPTINTFHGMPSLLHLSSTQSELGNSNVHYSGFDTDLSTPASVDDQINTNDDSVTNPVIEKCSFQRNTICLPPDIAFQVHLLSQMISHWGNDLYVFNEVIRCVKASTGTSESNQFQNLVLKQPCEHKTHSMISWGWSYLMWPIPKKCSYLLGRNATCSVSFEWHLQRITLTSFHQKKTCFSFGQEVAFPSLSVVSHKRNL